MQSGHVCYSWPSQVFPFAIRHGCIEMLHKYVSMKVLLTDKTDLSITINTLLQRSEFLKTKQFLVLKKFRTTKSLYLLPSNFSLLQFLL